MNASKVDESFKRVEIVQEREFVTTKRISEEVEEYPYLHIEAFFKGLMLRHDGDIDYIEKVARQECHKIQDEDIQVQCAMEEDIVVDDMVNARLFK